MNRDDLDVVLGMVEHTWGPLAPKERVEWTEALWQREPGACLEVIERERENARPALLRFMVMTNTRETCARCNASGFIAMTDPRFPGYEFVKPCVCRERMIAAAEHPKGCSCGECHYGVHRWRDIQAGVDGRPDAQLTTDASSGMVSARDAIAALAAAKVLPAGGDDGSAERADLA